LEIACSRQRSWTGEYITDYREILPDDKWLTDMEEKDGLNVVSRSGIKVVHFMWQSKGTPSPLYEIFIFDSKKAEIFAPFFQVEFHVLPSLVTGFVHVLESCGKYGNWQCHFPGPGKFSKREDF